MEQEDVAHRQQTPGRVQREPKEELEGTQEAEEGGCEKSRRHEERAKSRMVLTAWERARTRAHRSASQDWGTA